MTSADSLADPKAIGEDVEALVVDAVAGLRPAANADAYYDAYADTVIGPRTAPDVSFAGIALLNVNTRVEIKACKRHVSNGARGRRPGRWLFTSDQHERLLTDPAVYLLAVYEDDGDTKHLGEMVVVPASLLDEHLHERWYSFIKTPRSSPFLSETYQVRSCYVAARFV